MFNFRAHIDTKGEGFIGGRYLHSVTKNVALGAELGSQPGANFSLIGRYTGIDYTVSGIVSESGAQVCYYENMNDQLQFGLEMDTNFRVVIGYQVDLPEDGVCFRARVDSSWNVGAVLEKKLQPLPYCFSLSGMLSPNKINFQLGCGITIA